MSAQPEALRIAERCVSLASLANARNEDAFLEAAAELRRQHAALAKYEADDVRYMAELRRLHSVNAELLEELRSVLEWATTERAPLRAQEVQSIRRVVAKATGAAS